MRKKKKVLEKINKITKPVVKLAKKEKMHFNKIRDERNR